MPGFLPIIYLCFFLSGASSLIYEVVWMRWLVLTLGSTTAAVSTVLFAYMVGLALGGWAFGRVADRSRAPVRLYAYLEAGIGLYAILLPWLVAGFTPVYVMIARAVGGSPAALSLVRFVFASAALLLPTMFMGATLPVLVRLVARQRTMSRSLGLLYGTNVAGAVLGCSAAGFFLIRFLGLSGTTTVALVANLVAAALALLAGRGAARAGHAAEGAPASWAPSAAAPRSFLWIVVFLSGFVTMAWEVLWTRILVFSFDSTAQAFTVILAVFLAGLAIGSWIFGVIIAGKRESTATLAFVEIAAGILALILVPWSVHGFDAVLYFLDYTGYNYTTHAIGTALVSGGLMLPPTILLGIVFPMASRMLAEHAATVGRTIGRVYFVNTVGSALGALAAPFVLLPWLTLKGSFLALCLLPIAAGWWLILGSPLPARQRGLAFAGSAAVLGLCGVLFFGSLPGPNPFDPPSRFRTGGREVLAHHDGVTASVSVIEYEGGGRSLRIDGFEAAGVDAGMPYGYMQAMSHLPLLLHPDPRRVLVISFGTGSTAGATLLHPDTTVDLVDINQTVLDFAPYFGEANGNVIESPRSRAIRDDGRNYLLVSTETYDVITSEPMPPTFAGMVNLYSREYYVQAKERLKPGGYLVQWLPFHLLQWHQAQSILRTVQDVFPETSLWMHFYTGIIVARRDEPIELDIATLRRKTAASPLREGLQKIGLHTVPKLVNLYGLGPDRVRQLTEGAALITDDHPTLEFETARPLVPDDLQDSVRRIHALRLTEQPPLENVTAKEIGRLEDSRRAAISVQIAKIWYKTQQYQLAREQLDEALKTAKLPSNRALLLLHLAVTAEGEGKPDEALRHVTESLRLDPFNPEARQLRAALARRLAS